MSESKWTVFENSRYRYVGEQSEDGIEHKFLVLSTGELYTLTQSPFYSFKEDDFEYICRSYERNRLKYRSVGQVIWNLILSPK